MRCFKLLALVIEQESRKGRHAAGHHPGQRIDFIQKRWQLVRTESCTLTAVDQISQVRHFDQEFHDFSLTGGFPADFPDFFSGIHCHVFRAIGDDFLQKSPGTLDQMSHITYGYIVVHHHLCLAEVHCDCTGIAHFYQFLCQPWIPADLLEHEVQVDSLTAGFLKNLLRVCQEPVCIYDIGIGKNQSLLHQIKSRFHQFGVSFCRFSYEHLLIPLILVFLPGFLYPALAQPDSLRALYVSDSGVLFCGFHPLQAAMACSRIRRIVCGPLRLGLILIIRSSRPGSSLRNVPDTR